MSRLQKARTRPFVGRIGHRAGHARFDEDARPKFLIRLPKRATFAPFFSQRAATARTLRAIACTVAGGTLPSAVTRTPPASRESMLSTPRTIVDSAAACVVSA